MNYKRRLHREFRELRNNPPHGVSADLVDDDITHWTAIITGPSGTAYEGGLFKLDIKFSDDYPFKAPSARFLTKVYHPNVNGSGSICLDILKNQWSPALTMDKVLISISSLLETPNPDDPLDSEAARMYKKERPNYDKKVREYVQKYASQ